MKNKLHWQLTLLRDKSWMPGFVVSFIDRLRYGILNLKNKDMKKKTIGQMINLIQRKKCIYDIHFCRAGVGFLFYDPPQGFDNTSEHSGWRKYLKVEKYYPNITKATIAEYNKINSNSKK